MSRTFFVYILASRKLSTLYISYTADLARRLHEHREDGMPGFTSKYGVKGLVHYEVFDDPRIAQQWERSLKRWPQDWKTNLIERDNPDWLDLYGLLNR